MGFLCVPWVQAPLYRKWMDLCSTSTYFFSQWLASSQCIYSWNPIICFQNFPDEEHFVLKWICPCMVKIDSFLFSSLLGLDCDSSPGLGFDDIVDYISEGIIHKIYNHSPWPQALQLSVIYYSRGLSRNLKHIMLSEQPSHEQSIMLYRKDAYYICVLVTWLCNNRRTLLQSQHRDKSASSSANISQSYKNIICLFDCEKIYSHPISSPDCFCWTQ